MWSLPTGGGGGGGGGGGLDVELGWLADVLGGAALWLFDVPQAAIDNATAPVSNTMGSRAREGLGEVADINASPIAGLTRASGYPL